jgi:AcrR family transcriptional regulator
MAAVAHWADGRDLASPLNGPVRERVEQDASKVAAIHLRSTAVAVVGLVEKHRTVQVQYPSGLPAVMDDSAEFVEQSCRLERELSVVLMDVEHSPLRARIRRCLGFVDGGFDAVDVKNSRESEAAEACANDGNGVHGALVLGGTLFQTQLGTPFQICQDGAMTKAKGGSERREDALSRERVVDAAIELLDDEGEDGLTFRSLAKRLATGSGALYWHIKNKDELLVAASNVVVARALAGVRASSSPKKAIHSIALSVFETIDAHPWVGAQLARNPPPTALLRIFERIGHEVQALRVPGGAQFTATMVLGSYILSESRQNAANGHLNDPRPDRADFLEALAAQWEDLDADEFPFTRKVANQLREHDDRTEFLAGVDLILAGIAAGSPRSR